MQNNTVNKNNKPEYIQGAAGKKDFVITTNIILQNNEPHKLHVEVTNNKERKNNLPFIIENGELIEENDSVVVTKAKEDMTRAEFEAKKAKLEQEKIKNENGR